MGNCSNLLFSLTSTIFSLLSLEGEDWSPPSYAGANYHEVSNTSHPWLLLEVSLRDFSSSFILLLFYGNLLCVGGCVVVQIEAELR